MTKRPLSASDHRVAVTRGDVEWEVVVRYDGRYRAATRLDPEEWPDPYVAFAWRNGEAMSNPMDVPEDVVLEAAAIDAERVDDEPDPPEDDEDHSSAEP